MARVSICQAVLLLLCLQVTRARANRRLVGAQPQHDEVYGDVYKNADPELQNEIIEEYNYIYIDDPGQGVRWPGTLSQSSVNSNDDPDNEVHIEECSYDQAEGSISQGRPCDLQIHGADANHPGRIPFGVDGVYKMIGCFSGFPVYQREGKTRLERRILWFSHVFEDWDVIAGDFTRDQINRPPLMYGASSPIQGMPQLLDAASWQVMSVYHPARADLAYVPGNVSVQCMDGSLPHGESSMTTDSMATGTAEALAVLRAVDM